jgi:Winged helix-turn helix
MRGRKKTFAVTVSDSQRAELRRWLRSTTLAAGLARRARLILLLDEGRTYADAAQTAGLTIRNARKWALRFVRHGLTGLTGLHDQPGRGRQPVFSPRGRTPSGQDGVRTAG